MPADLSAFGGQNAYAASQGDRYKQALQSGDADLKKRLEADAARVGYSLPQAPAAQLAKATNSGDGGSPSTTLTSADPYSPFGGRDAYATSQGDRYKQALQSGDAGLQQRLQADASRVGYSLSGGAPVTQQAPATGSTVSAGAVSGARSDAEATEAYNRMFPGSALNRSTGQMQQYGQQLAGLQINPQREQLQRSLEQAMANATAQQGSINAAYQGVPQQLQQAAEEARKRALESAIARGVGRSGVVDYQNTRIGEEQQRQLGQSEAAKAAQLAAVANQLGLTQQQAQQQFGQLASREGELASAYIPQAEEAQFGRQMQVTPYYAPTQGQLLGYRGQIESGVGQVAPAWSPYGAGAGTPQAGTPQAGLNAATAAQGQQGNGDLYSQWGGQDAYATSQRDRYQQAIQSGDADLKKRLEADAARVGYSL